MSTRKNIFSNRNKTQEKLTVRNGEMNIPALTPSLSYTYLQLCSEVVHGGVDKEEYVKLVQLKPK